MTEQKDKTKATTERLIPAYDKMLQRVEHKLGTAVSHAEGTLKQALAAAREKSIEVGELTHDEADKVHDFVTRDLYDVAKYLAMGEREVTDWLRLNVLSVEKALLDRFSGLAHAAKLEIKHLEKAKRRLDEWHTGEVTTIGTLRCRGCGEILHFERTGHIPPCPKCHATVYERIK